MFKQLFHRNQALHNRFAQIVVPSERSKDEFHHECDDAPDRNGAHSPESTFYLRPRRIMAVPQGYGNDDQVGEPRDRSIVAERAQGVESQEQASAHPQEPKHWIT